ncbi:MAG: hypothetical protein LBT23_03530 [Synergistaceae bacterium]|jgi:hypothetical protein|nr:hypothetical protein [Synergistaceae bacterium]
MRKRARKYLLNISLALLSLFFTFLILERSGALAAWFDPPVPAPRKSEIALDDDDSVRRGAEKANVLFFLDTSHPMMIEPRGKMPYVVGDAIGNINDAQTLAHFGYTRAEALDMMRYVTFGVGTVPPADSFYTAAVTNLNNYGRDTNTANNLVGDIDNPDNRFRYYSPYEHAGHNLSDTFRNQDHSFRDAVAGGAALPYMLVFKNPAHWRHGLTTFTADDLVPNDSRMYQLKLVMWRLLEDRLLFENIRFGMSTVYTCAFTAGYGTFTSSTPENTLARTAINHMVYKINPWGRDSTGTGTFPQGSYYVLNDAINTVYSGRMDLAHGMQGGTWGVTSAGDPNYQRRAFLRVPIADYNTTWTTKDENVHMTQLERFRLWMDGVEDVAGQLNTGTNDGAAAHHLNAGQFDIHKNPELKVSSPVPLSQTIFPMPGGTYPNQSRAWHLANRGIAYAKKEKIFYNTGTGDIYNFYFKPGSGQAVGNVFDFFSPDMGTFGTGDGVSLGAGGEREKFGDMIDEQFPIRNVCDPNYVILFTAGDNSPADYPLSAAVHNLYTYTRDNDVTVMYYENGDRMFTRARLAQPIKTIVVGFVDPDDTSPTVVALKNNLTAMAREGQGYAATDTTSPAHAYFAKDVPALLEALREIMVIINNDIQPVKGAMLEGDIFSEDVIDEEDIGKDLLNLYVGSYRINFFDQWEGGLTKYVTAKDKETGVMKTKRDGDTNERLLSKRDALAGSRTLQYWAGASGLQPIAYTGSGSGSKSSPHPLADQMGLGDEILASMDMSVIPGGSFAGKTHPSRAIIDWFYGFDVSYIDNIYYSRRSMLSDQGNSGISKVGPPPVQVGDSLPLYNEFAAANTSLPTKLYIQTNDGILHVVNPQTMQEDRAILPPPSLLPRRLFSLKTTITDNKYRWVDVKDYMAVTSQDIPMSSIPSFVLDGPLQARYFYLGSHAGNDATKWRAFLIGTLGRGGGGIYAMDVTKPQDPEFYWYRENVENADGSLTTLWQFQGAPSVTPRQATVNRDSLYWTDLYTNREAHAFEQLGFNSPKPYFAVARTQDTNKLQNIIALPGGLQNSLDASDNGKMGAALYIIDPDLAYHVDQKPPAGGARVFNSGSLASVSTNWRSGSETYGDDPYMGMMVSEPSFQTATDNQYISDGVYAADNRGSIFYVSFVEPGSKAHRTWDEYDIRTIGSIRAAAAPTTANYSIPSGVIAASRNASMSQIWIAGGTSDVGGRNGERLTNEEQMIFSFKMPNLETGTMSTRAIWTSLSRDLPNDGIDVNKIPPDEGWYIPLQAGNADYAAEYVTTQPLMFGGVLYVATFRERKTDINNASLCDSGKVLGISRLYAVEMDTGKAGMWGNDEPTKFLEFDGLKFIGFTLSQRGNIATLLITYNVLDKNAADLSKRRHTDDEGTLNDVEGLDALSQTLGSGDGSPPIGRITSNDSVLNYWLYNNR